MLFDIICEHSKQLQYASLYISNLELGFEGRKPVVAQYCSLCSSPYTDDDKRGTTGV